MLRLWVSSVDYTGDVCVGENVIKQVCLFFCAGKIELLYVTVVRTVHEGEHASFLLKPGGGEERNATGCRILVV